MAQSGPRHRDNQRWNIDDREVVAKVFIPGRHAGKASRGRAPAAMFQLGLDRLLANPLTQENICVVEVLENSVKNAYRSAATAFWIPSNTLPSTPSGIVGGLQKIRGNASDDHSPGHTL